MEILIVTDEEPVEPVAENTSNHWQLARNVAVFQFKLAMDGLRDILLSPVSILAALYGLISHPENPGIHFDRLLTFGRRTDVWINLFEQADGSDQEQIPSSDAYIQKLEDLLITEYQKGGLVRDLKESTDTIIKRIRNRRSEDE